MNKFLISIFSLALFVSCGQLTNDSISGTYVLSYENTIDTLVLKRNGIYSRSLYRKNDESMIFKNESDWVFDKKARRIKLNNYLVGNDSNYSLNRNEDYYNDLLMKVFLPIEKIFSKTKIIVPNRINTYYVKID